MPQLAIAAAGAYIGSAALGATALTIGGVAISGASIGWTVGSILGAYLFAPDNPGAQLQDTRSAKLQFGARIPRVAGRVRLPLSPRWTSDWRAEEQESGGKGGGGGASYFTYSADGLFWAADATPDIKPIALTRLWHNGKLVWSALADSDIESLTASEDAALFAALEFHDGNAAQLPWPVYEAAVGSANADAHRRITCVSLEGYQAGTSPQWGLLEGEFITAGTQGATDALTVLQSDFYPDSTDDSWYANGTGTITGSPGTSGTFSIDNTDDASDYVTWTDAVLGYTGNHPLTIEGFVDLVFSDRNFTQTIVRYEYAGTIHQLSWYGTSQRIEYQNNGGVNLQLSAVTSGRTHFAMVFGGTYTIAIYVGGSPIYQQGGGGNPSFVASASVRIGYVTAGHPEPGRTAYTIDSFRARREEVYTGAFMPPAALPPPDFPIDIWTPLPEDLQDVCDSEMARCRRVGAWYDNGELAGIDVTGIAMNSSARTSLEQLASSYYFGAVCRDQLITRARGSAVVATIANANTGAATDSPGQPFTGVEMPDDLEVPAYWSVTSPDVDADYEAGTETSDRLITNGVEVRQVQLLTVLTPAERKGRANAMAMDAWVGAHTGALSLSDAYAALEPCDVIAPTDDEGNGYRMRIVRESYAQGVKSLELVLDDASALPTTGLTASPYSPTVTVAGSGEVDGILLDGPIARDADDDHGVYWVTDLSEDATAASLFRSTDDVTFANVLDSTGDAVTGAASTTLANWTGGYLRDDVSSVRVTVSGTLASATDDQVLQDESVNAFALGAHGRWEYGQFLDATLVSTNSDGTYTYDLTRFLRGRRGSESAMSQHTSSDTFILMRLTGLRRYTMDAGEVGLTRYFKSVPAGRRASTIASAAFVNSAVGRKPYAGVHAEVTRDGSNNATITWSRRSRLSCSFVGATPISCPLGEASEAYEVDIYASGAYATVLRTISTTAASAAYSAANQTADGLTPGDPLYFRIYQLSETVGRGYALEATA